MKKLSRSDAVPRAARGPAFSQAGLARPVAWTAPHDLDRLRASARGRLGKPLVPTSVSSPRLSDELFARLLAYGTPQPTRPGDVLFSPGDEDLDLKVVGGPGKHALLAVEGVLGPHADEAGMLQVLIVVRGLAHRPWPWR